jgi:c-di-GMP-binding flagellar brake protein YcgR
MGEGACKSNCTLTCSTFSKQIKRSARCELVFEKESGEIGQLNLPVFDISGGGIGLMVAEEQSAVFSRGASFENCLLTLPDEGQAIVDITVRNTFEITTRSGLRYLRVGCEYIHPPGQALNKIQRYITRIERERNART